MGKSKTKITPEGFIISNDKKSDDYTPFYGVEGDLYQNPPTLEEMREKGYTTCEYLSEDGYYAWVCTKNKMGCQNYAWGCQNNKENLGWISSREYNIKKILENGK